MDTPVIDQAKLEAFAMRAIGDLTAGYTGVMVSLGTKLGLYKAMAGAGPLSAKEVAARAGCAERYVREWLERAGRRRLPRLPRRQRHLRALARAGDGAGRRGQPRATSRPPGTCRRRCGSTRTRRSRPSAPASGVAWGEHDARMACGVAAFYRNGYRASLVPQWLPALDGVVAQLEAGIAVADVGCGHGHSTLLMAEAFPNSRFHGFDTHAASIDEARRHAAEAGVAGSGCDFELARAVDYPDRRYGLICFFDSLHDLGDPVAAARHAAEVLAPGGTVMLVEPFANDRVEDNLSPVGQLYYAGSTADLLRPRDLRGRQARARRAGRAEARLAEVFRKAGFTHFRRAAETPVQPDLRGSALSPGSSRQASKDAHHHLRLAA